MEQKLIPAYDPLGRALQIDLVGDFAPLGVRLRLETNSREILEACRASFGRYRPLDSKLRVAQFVIRLIADKDFTSAPPWPAPVFRAQGSIFYVSVGSQNTAVADVWRRHAVGFVSPAMAQDAGFLRATFLDCLVLTMMTSGRGVTHTYVHASAVTQGDKGIILSGPRESGKSTLAYACARRGFQVVTDDVVYLSEGEDGLTAWGRPWRLRFLPDCARFFPELTKRIEALQTPDQGVVEIEVEELLPGRTKESCRPVALFFLNRTSGPASYEKLEPDAAVQLLARDLIYDSPEVMEKHRRAWTTLASKGSFVLHYGEDLDAVVGLLERFIEVGRQGSQTAW